VVELGREVRRDARRLLEGVDLGVGFSAAAYRFIPPFRAAVLMAATRLWTRAYESTT